jgi:hypothetical protein
MSSASFQESLGVIRQSSAYPKPIDGTYEGQPVRILASGDIVGMSPAVQIVDENGRLDWVSAEEVTVTQRRFLPATQRAQLRQKWSTQTPRQFSHQ